MYKPTREDMELPFQGYIESKIKTGYNIVFLWKKNVDIENATFSNIQNDMNKIFDKAHIMKNKEM